jgi:hypothetical protein
MPKVKVAFEVEVSVKDMEDIMVTALEGGINYWCGSAKIIDNPANTEWASDVVAHGGKLELTDVEEPDEKWILDQEKLLKGFAKGMEWGNFATVEDLMDSHDAETADVIVQYALFDEIVFG